MVCEEALAHSSHASLINWTSNAVETFATNAQPRERDIRFKLKSSQLEVIFTFLLGLINEVLK